jgi:hypothetical protein
MADETLDSAYSTRPLTADTWGDFANLVEANNGVWGGCWCVGFTPRGSARAALSPRTATPSTHTCVRERFTRSSSTTATSVGWCRYGPPGGLPTIKNSKAYNAELTDLPDWRIGCLFTGKATGAEGSRGQR